MKNSFKELEKVIIHRIKEQILLYKFYGFSFRRKRTKKLFVSIFDDRRNSFGLTDRFKGIISLYAYSKIRNTDYKCHFTSPFNLSKFFIPNKYNWLLNKEELSSSVHDVRILILHGEPEGKRLINLNSSRQIHAYINRDYLPIFNKKFGTNFVWGELFKELFKPTQNLKEQLDYYLNKIGPHYIGCVFRFQSLLGDFKEYNFEALVELEKQSLINKCVDALITLKNESKKPVLVTSDSSTFLSVVSSMDGIFTMEGKVVHLDCVNEESDEVYMKSFVDFMMLSKAEKIYSVGTDKMYPTEFPLYAAKINNIPFERILI